MKKIKNKNKLLIPCLMLMVMASCKFAPDALNVPNWDMDLLGPLVNTTANGNKIVQMKTLKGSASVNISKFGLQPGTYSGIPAIGPIDTLPAFHFQLFNAFKSLTLESGMMYFTLDNNMPITLKSGAWITITDSISGDVLMHVQLNADVPPLPASGGHYQYTTGVDLAGKTIEDNLLIKITNLSTGASAGSVNVSGNESFTVMAFLEGATLHSATILSDSAEFRDTSVFSMQGYKVKTQVTGGTITVFIDNGLPFDLNLQFYFMREDKITIVDSLFDNGTFIPAALSSTQPSSDSLPFTITDTKLKNMLEARYINTSLKVKNVTSGITLSKDDSIKLLLVGHLQVKLN